MKRLLLVLGIPVALIAAAYGFRALYRAEFSRMVNGVLEG